MIEYRIVQNSCWANQSFQSFGEENVGDLYFYLSESWVWLGKLLVNNV